LLEDQKLEKCIESGDYKSIPSQKRYSGLTACRILASATSDQRNR